MARDLGTICFIGCGKLGSALLEGLLKFDVETRRDEDPRQHYIVCVRSSESRDRLKSKLSPYLSCIEFLVQANVQGATKARTLILGCRPAQYRDITSEPGVTPDDIHGAVSCGQGSGTPRCKVARGIPNVAASLRHSVTVVQHATESIDAEAESAAVSLYSRVGRVQVLAAKDFDAALVLSASCPAFFAAMADAMIKSASTEGLSEEMSTQLIAGSMWGCSHLLLEQTAKEVQRRVATPGGMTARGLGLLEESGVGKAIEKAVRETLVASRSLQNAGSK